MASGLTVSVEDDDVARLMRIFYWSSAVWNAVRLCIFHTFVILIVHYGNLLIVRRVVSHGNGLLIPAGDE